MTAVLICMRSDDLRPHIRLTAAQLHAVVALNVCLGKVGTG